MKRIFFIALISALVTSMFTSCENGDWDFPDYDYSTVYFAYQNPVRTVVLGDDIYDTSLDNEHKVQIMATMGGVYSNNSDVTIGYSVDESLVDNLVFADSGADVLVMPSNYYSFLSDRIVIKKGAIIGGVTVQLKDEFFNDPLALTTNYVIPLVMTNVNNADSILSGLPIVPDPKRTISDDWDVQPKDYIMYAVKYINKYDAIYLRRGTDELSGDQTGTISRKAEYVEKDEVITNISTRSLNTIVWEHESRDKDNFSRSCMLVLTFDAEGKCTIVSETPGVTASGTGKFVSKGEKNSWGNKDRDALYLKYTIDYGTIQFDISDTMVVRDRGVKAEWFTSEVK